MHFGVRTLALVVRVVARGPREPGFKSQLYPNVPWVKGGRKKILAAGEQNIVQGHCSQVKTKSP